MYFKIVAIFLLGIILPLLNVMANDFIIKSQTDAGLEIELTPQLWQINKEMIAGKLYYKIKFQNCTFNTSAGEPQIPERVMIVGIPVNSQVTTEVLEVEEEKTFQGRIIPAPTYRQNEMAEISYNENKTSYNSLGMLPAQFVKIASYGMMGNQQVVVLRIKPVQYFPGKDQIKLYNRIVVRVNFTGGERLYNASDKIATESIHDQVLINSKQAAKWRKERARTKQLNLNKEYPVDWYKIYVREEGIYKITGTQLKATGIDLRNIKPDQVKIFNNGGFQLPPGINTSRVDSLIENAIIVSDGGDNKFDDEDYILFYGKAVNGWRMNAEEKKYLHYLNPFTRDNVYWLCWQSPEPGKRMQARSVKNNISAIKVDSYQEYIYLENEYTNLLKSGTTWFGDYFSAGYPRRNYQFDLSGIDTQKNADLRLTLAGVSSGEHRFRLYINDMIMPLEPVFYSSSGRSLSYVTRQFHTAISNGMRQGYNNVTIEYQPAGGEGLAYLDWIEFSYQRRLEARDDQLKFYGADSASVYQYLLSSFSSSDILVFNISDFSNVSRFEISQLGGGLVSFTDSTAADLPSQYFAVSPKRFKSVSKIVKDSPSRLREDQDGADFIIITHDDFYDAALALKSLRENCDSLTASVVKISDVFDEFAWGLIDPNAIRDFIKFAYENWSMQPRYVLLLGDGDYDYKNIISPNDPNWIPPFETSEPNELSSRARDDWFVCVAGNDNLMDLAIGRIPARNPDQA
ncbi:MAG: C25 family cysteine peptidase, partial [bacterium]|nr:C25 family cysteine peptidase [bacterium]